MKIQPNFPQKAEFKEMLGLSTVGSKRKVSINYSSMEIINSCMRKAHYELDRKLKGVTGESPALTFGSAIHNALEHWYLFPKNMRRKMAKVDIEQATLLAQGFGVDKEADSLELEAIRQFMLRADNNLPMDNDKRSRENGVKILTKYFNHYIDDSYTVATDDDGPLVERNLRMVIHEDSDLIVEYHGTIDVVFFDERMEEYVVVDHKTTSSLGNEFRQRQNPNHQYSGYMWLTREKLGLDADTFLINGIQVAKTMQKFERIETKRTEHHFAELKLAILYAVSNYLDCLDHEFFPQNAPSPCVNWGGCKYRDICEQTEELRENIISYKFEEPT